MKLFMFAASLRKDSCNKKLIQIIAQIIKEQGMVADFADFSEFSAPLYNEDIQNNVGFPAEILHFTQRLQEADGLIISSPEYNFSTPGTLKNLIDWVSRIKPMPWKGYPILLMSASPSLVGGNRGLWSTRIPLEACGGLVFPDMFSLAGAFTAFDEHGNLKESQLHNRLRQNVTEFIDYVAALKNGKKKI
jgi:chromate reductase